MCEEMQITKLKAGRGAVSKKVRVYSYIKRKGEEGKAVTCGKIASALELSQQAINEWLYILIEEGEIQRKRYRKGNRRSVWFYWVKK